MESWVWDNLRGSSNCIDWPMHFAFSLWWIYRWWNSKIFHDVDEVPTDMKLFLARIFQEMSMVQQREELVFGSCNNVRVKRLVTWVSPS